MTIEESFLH